ncbi:MAG: integrase [Pseudomonadota bacterium]
MAKIIPFISPVEQNCQINQARLKEKGRLCGAFSDVPWEQPSWNVTATYAHRKRGHKSNRQNDYIHFTRHAAESQKLGDPIEEPLAGIVKALVALRQLHRGQSPISHMVFIRACRYVRDALVAKRCDVTDITSYEFDEAAKAAMDREGETTAYKLIGHLEELAGLIDANRLSKIRLDWRCRVKKRPQSLSPDRIETAATSSVPDTDRLPPEEAIQALAKLYCGNDLPKDVLVDDPRFGDRLLLLITVVLICTGLRLGEALTLRAMKVRSSRDGSKFLEYYVEKHSPGNVKVEVKQKVLMSDSQDLVAEVIDELLDKTQAAREAARYIFEHHEVPVRLPDISVLTKQDVFDAVGVSDNLTAFLRARKIPYEVERLSGFAGRGGTKRLLVQREDFLAGLLRDNWGRPVLPGDNPTRLELHEALCVAFVHQFHSERLTLRYAVKPIHEGNVRDFLMGRESSKAFRRNDGAVTDSLCKVMNVFEKYGIADENGDPYGLRSHGFRHFLNHLLDEGGLPELLQAKWFGRKNVADTKAYQHMIPAQRAAKLHEEILSGNADGYVPRVLQLVPIERRQAFLDVRIRAVHDVGPGICIHDFAQLPCEKHLECTNDCQDYVWIKGDEDRVSELKRQAAFALVAHETVKRVTDNPDTYVESDWLRHSAQKLKTLESQLASYGLAHIDLVELAKQYAGEA